MKIDENRLIDIETKIAFQEQTIKDLNDVIYEQQKEIKRIAALCDSLAKQGEDFRQSSPGIDSPDDEKPPHY